MRSIHLLGNRKLEIIEVPEPVPGPGEVIVKTQASVLCGSELHAFRGNGMAKGNSGHEGAGIVVALGEGVTHLKCGQRVGVSAISGCGKCDYCAKGQYTWCKKFKFYGSMHSEFFKAAAIACNVLPDDIGWDVGVLITGDGMGVPCHTATKIKPEDKVIAVFGAGPIGLGNIIWQSALGREIIAVDFSDYRLEKALASGAKHAINPKNTDPIAAIRDLTNGLGADVCIEAVGRPETVGNCFDAVRTGGQVIFNGEQGEVPLSISNRFIRRDITATGSWFFHFSEFGKMLEEYRKGLPVASLISHKFPFDQAEQAFNLFADGLTAKVMLEY